MVMAIKHQRTGFLMEEALMVGELRDEHLGRRVLIEDGIDPLTGRLMEIRGEAVNTGEGFEVRLTLMLATENARITVERLATDHSVYVA